MNYEQTLTLLWKPRIFLFVPIKADIFKPILQDLLVSGPSMCTHFSQQIFYHWHKSMDHWEKPLSWEYESYTAVAWQRDPSDIAPMSLVQPYHLHTKHELNDTPNEPSQTQAEEDNSFVLYHDILTFNAVTCIELLTSCATDHYVNGILETNTREPMSLVSFCRGMAV